MRLLAEDFNRLRKVRRDLPERVLRYLLDNEGDDVLPALRKSGDCGKVLGMNCCGYAAVALGETTPRVRFFEQASISDHEFFLRLAQVYDAASSSSQRRLDGHYLPRPLR